MLSSTARTTKRHECRVTCITTCFAEHLHHSPLNVHVCYVTPSCRAHLCAQAADGFGTFLAVCLHRRHNRGGVQQQYQLSPMQLLQQDRKSQKTSVQVKSKRCSEQANNAPKCVCADLSSPREDGLEPLLRTHGLRNLFPVPTLLVPGF